MQKSLGSWWTWQLLTVTWHKNFKGYNFLEGSNDSFQILFSWELRVASQKINCHGSKSNKLIMVRNWSDQVLVDESRTSKTLNFKKIVKFKN